VRVIVGLLLFCLSATSAHSDGAVSFGAAANITVVHGLSVNQKTRELAMGQANAQCRARVNGLDVTEPCTAQSVFRNRCVAIIELRTYTKAVLDGITLYAGTGSDLSEARTNATAVCTDVARVVPGVCQIRDTACDFTDEGTNARIGQWVTKTLNAVTSGWADKFDALQSWWRDTVTATFLVVSAAFLVLSAALLHTTIQLRKLKLMLAPPPISHATPRWWQFGTSRSFAIKAAPKTKDPLKGPVLDEQTIREAFKTDPKQREEFDL
jgi:Domain of unknown function (DUF4189)